MTLTQVGNKAKIAKRVVDIFEFIDDEGREVTVMDIVRRYDWPQSSTSELLASLVDLGLLYKNPLSRTYSLSQRAAMLGSGFQPAIVRDGRLTHLIDQLVVQTGLTVATFGIVGIRSQIFSWRSRTGNPSSGALSNLYGGVQERLTGSAAGWLLLSTIAQPRRDGLIRRLLADQEGENKPTFADMASRVSACQARGYAHGPVGCGSTAEVMALLLPGQPERHPLAIGFVYEPSLQIDQAALLQCLQEAVEPYIQAGDSRPIPFPHPTRPTYSEPELKAV